MSPKSKGMWGKLWRDPRLAMVQREPEYNAISHADFILSVCLSHILTNRRHIFNVVSGEPFHGDPINLGNS